MPQSFSSLHFHVIFSIKGRIPLLRAELTPRLYEYFGGILRTKNAVLVAAGGMPDHVHLLCNLGRDLAVADAVRLLKSNSSKWLHETYPDLHTFAWQAGYAVFSVSYSNLGEVRRYIGDQE